MSVHKPAEKEEEYFARQEYERLRDVECEKKEKMAEEERANLQELHFMKCPKCGSDLVTVDYRDMKIDRCPCCEGVWLDKGELDTIAGMGQSLRKRLFEKFFEVKEWTPGPGL